MQWYSWRRLSSVVALVMVCAVGCAENQSPVSQASSSEHVGETASNPAPSAPSQTAIDAVSDRPTPPANFEFNPSRPAGATDPSPISDRVTPVAARTNQAATPQLANTWSQFRGPRGLAMAPAVKIPTEWSEDQNLAWKTPLPGAGSSSPVVYGDRIYLTAYTGYGVTPRNPGNMDDLKRALICLRLDTGEILWQREVAAVLPETPIDGRIQTHGYASSTPVVDDLGIYCFYGASGVVAFDHDGNQLWQTSVGNTVHGWGSAASPVLVNDLVVVNAYVECGCLVALDKQTGQEKWRARGLKESWNTPLLVDLPGGKQELAVANSGRILGFDPATGEELWSCKSMDWYIVGSMVAHEGVIYCLAGKGVEATLAVRGGGRGDVTATHVAWRANKGSNVSSPVYHNGHLYFAHESQGIAYCLDAGSGAVKYEQRLPRVGEIYASPIVADGKLIYISRGGDMVVLDAQPEYRLLAHNRFASDRSLFNASPAVADGKLLIRSDRHLYCIQSR